MKLNSIETNTFVKRFTKYFESREGVLKIKNKKFIIYNSKLKTLNHTLIY